MEIEPIARIYTQFPTKFGIPRQSGLAGTKAKIVFEPAYRDPSAVRGLEDYSHIWLIWEFTEAKREKWSPTVRPPRLGGNVRMGVFATRSPFRPNSLGLSCVKLESIDMTGEGAPVLYVCGADILDGTPIYDIKPYLPFTDAPEGAVGGFADEVKEDRLSVSFRCELPPEMSGEERRSLISVLKQDPRPHYQHDSGRIYAFEFARYRIRFICDDTTLTVLETEELT